MKTDEYDVVVVGGGTAGCYAAATVAREGMDVALLERKDEEEAGHIACGDALKGSDTFPDSIDKDRVEESFTNTGVTHGKFEFKDGDTVDIPIPGELAVVDRKKYGEIILEETEKEGVDIHYETVVNDVVQNGKVEGVKAKRDSEPVEYDADVVIDGAGALSVLQDKADLSESTFDQNVKFTQFCSAYREIIEVEEPVEWSDALVFKPTERSAGYLWYFPRTDTEINAGLGFQMNEEPMELVESLKEDLEGRPEFENAEVKDKLGAALPTRRPYDSAVAPGFMAVGDAAGHVNPTTGGGIAGAAYAGKFAGEAAVDAISEGDVSEENLWEYNERVMEKFGARYGALDVYNIFVTAYETDDIMDLFASLPGEKISEALYDGKTSLPLSLKLRIGLSSFGHWGLIYKFYQAKKYSEKILETYENYPSHPNEFEDWREDRDKILDGLYNMCGADPKY